MPSPAKMNGIAEPRAGYTLTPKRLRAGYGPIYRALSRCGADLSTAAKLVLLNLLERLGENDFAYPSQETMANDTALSIRAIRYALRELEARRFLSTRRRGLGLPNDYVPHIEAIAAWADGSECRTTRHVVPNSPAHTAEDQAHPPTPPLKQDQDQQIQERSAARKRHAPVDEAFIEELSQEHASVWGSPEAAREVIVNRAMNGKAYAGYQDKRRGLRAWMKEASASRKERQAHYGNGRQNSARTPGVASPYSNDALLARLSKSEPENYV